MNQSSLQAFPAGVMVEEHYEEVGDPATICNHAGVPWVPVVGQHYGAALHKKVHQHGTTAISGRILEEVAEDSDEEEEGE